MTLIVLALTPFLVLGSVLRMKQDYKGMGAQNERAGAEAKDRDARRALEESTQNQNNKCDGEGKEGDVTDKKKEKKKSTSETAALARQDCRRVANESVMMIKTVRYVIIDMMCDQG